MHVYYCQTSKGSSQTMPCNINRSISIQCSQRINSVQDLIVDELPSRVKSKMNLTLRALRVASKIHWQIDDPILNTRWSSKHKDNSIDFLQISTKPLKVSSWHWISLDTFHRVFRTFITWPLVDGWQRIIGYQWHVCHWFCFLRTVARMDNHQKNHH